MIPRIRIHERHVLMWLLGATLATMAVGGLWLGLSHHEEHKLVPGGTAHVRWMRPGQHSIVADYFDPSMMSLPDRHGFSGTAWRHLAPVAQTAYEPERAPAYLAVPASAPIPVLLSEPSLGVLAQTGIALPSVEPVVDAVATVTALTNSVLELSGQLKERRIVASPVLPLAGGPARMTRVFIAVAADGRVRYAVLIPERSSGNEKLDSAAVEAVRQVRFAPEPNIDPLALTWGAVRLVWAARI